MTLSGSTHDGDGQFLVTGLRPTGGRKWIDPNEVQQVVVAVLPSLLGAIDGCRAILELQSDFVPVIHLEGICLTFQRTINQSPRKSAHGVTLLTRPAPITEPLADSRLRHLAADRADQYKFNMVSVEAWRELIDTRVFAD